MLLFTVALREHYILLFDVVCSYQLIWRYMHDQWRHLRRRQSLFRGIFLSLCEGVMNFAKHDCFIEVVRNYTFDISHPYLKFCRTVEVDRIGDSNFCWFPYSAGDGLVSDIPATEAQMRKHCIDN